jgi:hypothetical protein
LIKSLPADGRARLFKIDAHDDFQAVGKFLAQRVEPRRVFQRAFFVVNRARADHDQQPRVFPPQDADDPLAAVRDHRVDGVGRRCLRLQFARRQQPDDFL